MKRAILLLLLLCSVAAARNGRLGATSIVDGTSVTNMTINNITSTTIEATTIQNVTNVYTTDIRVSGKAVVYVDNPPFYFDQVTAGDTDWWLGAPLTGSADGISNDVFAAGTASNQTGFGSNIKIAVDPNGAIRTAAVNNPDVVTNGESQWDADDYGTVTSDGTNKFYTAQKLKFFSMSVYDPDTIQGVEDAIPVLPVEAEKFPAGITLVDVGIKTDASSTYAVNFEEWTSPTDGSPSTIEAVTTSASTEAEDDGTLSDAAIAAGSIIYVDLPATDIDMLVVWGTYYVNTND